VASTVFTLIFVPTIFDLAMHLSDWLTGRRHPGRQRKIERGSTESAEPETTLIYEP
jgi:hypothetical protein